MDECPDILENYTSTDNFHNFDFSKVRMPRHPSPSLWQISTKSFIVICIVLLGIFGNYLVIHVVVRFKQSRTCTNLFICNMAIADFLGIIFCAWAALITNLVQDYVLGQVYCKVESFSKLVCLLASVFSLITISFDRLLVIVNPVSSHLTTRRAYIYILIIWTLSILISFPLIIWREFKTNKWCDATEHLCREIGPALLYWLVILALLVYIPVVVMSSVYVVIILKMRMYERKVGTENSSTRFKYRRKIVMMLFFYLISSLVCWLPLQITVYFTYFKTYGEKFQQGKWRLEAQFISHVFITINSTLNPIIYGIANESFRRSILTIHPKMCFLLGKKSPSMSTRVVTPIATPPIDLNLIHPRRSTSTSHPRSNGFHVNTLSSNNLNLQLIPNRILCRRELQR